MVLFDVDGTLVLTGGAGLRALGRAFAAVLGLPDACAGLAAHGKTDPMLLEEVCGRHLGRSPTAAEAEALVATYVAHLEDEVARAERYRVLPGVEGALGALSARGATVGLATGNVEAGARIKLERGGLWRRFGFGGYGSDEADRGALVARAIERGEARAGRRFDRAAVLVIGDTVRDVAAAHACGARAVAVATGPDPVPTLRAAGADVVLETLEALPAWLGGAGPRS